VKLAEEGDGADRRHGHLEGNMAERRQIAVDPERGMLRL
jgi:hypothetical protein